MKNLVAFEHSFELVKQNLIGALQDGEAMTLSFYGEDSLFMRFNNAQVRQIGTVQVVSVSYKLFFKKRTLEMSVTLPLAHTHDEADLVERCTASLKIARAKILDLPEDPYQTLPTATSTSKKIYSGDLLSQDEVPAKILGAAQGLDFTGLHAQGLIVRASANSAGASHFFATENFNCNYSLWLKNGKAVKSSYAEREWNQHDYERVIATGKEQLTQLQNAVTIVPPGEYPVYLEPGAVNELLPFFSWYGLSERAIREGESAFIALRENRKQLSSTFSLTQDFSLGLEPSFNEEGEVAPEQLQLINAGKLQNTLVSSRSSLQYKVNANASPLHESLRAPVIAAGSMNDDFESVLQKIGTGLYLPNLHYLNWSDVSSARITGMTRFAAFWVENARVVGPIKDMRFDVSLYDILGANLLELTQKQSVIAEDASYGLRATGGALLPGMLIDKFKFTL